MDRFLYNKRLKRWLFHMEFFLISRVIKKTYGLLEPDALRGACPVLRGELENNLKFLPDYYHVD